MKKAAALASLVLMASCASPGGYNGPYSPVSGSLYERQVIGALGVTQANGTQRQAVLAAYDRMAPLLKQNDAADLKVQRRWDSLDPKSAGYLADAELLAKEAATLAAERITVLAQFNQAVAAALDGGQWSRWSSAMRDERAAFENARRIDPTYRPGER